MAAGLGTRMRSSTPKVLHPLCGRPVLAYVIDAAVAATGARPLVVISPPVAMSGRSVTARTSCSSASRPTASPVSVYEPRCPPASAPWTTSASAPMPAAVDASAGEVTVTHTPTGYSASCWDRDQDGQLDAATEDFNGDGLGSIEDCYPGSVRDIYLEFELLNAVHELLLARPNPILEETGGDGLAKVVSLEEE